MTGNPWRKIVESLGNQVQQRIVADERKRTNVLVLAGPGSGKTRVLVHRIAWLIRARRENARGIIALTYNRHAAVEIRRRLGELIGEDARGVTVLTCHALAMRLAGESFTGRSERPDDGAFKDVMRRAIALLRGEDLLPDEAEERRGRLLAGFRWILVDEYQDVGAEQYELISALAGRTLQDEAGKLNLFAVGDDDQNVYAFAGASVEYIRRFETDYRAKTAYLTDNYRSTVHIVAAANAVIEPARNRMKTGHPIHVDRRREKEPPGGAWTDRDPVARGKVQILPVGRDPIERPTGGSGARRVRQARTVMAEFLRLSELAPDWDWSRAAVIARKWKYLFPVRAFCEAHGIPVQMANEQIPRFWHLRETRAFVGWLRRREPQIVDAAASRGWLDAQPAGPWHDLLRQAANEYALEAGNGETPVDRFVEWLAEWGQEVRRRQSGLLLLTAHRAKGLEFDHVAVLDGGWTRSSRGEDPDARRRLYYVAMTRARQTLVLAHFDGSSGFETELDGHTATIRRTAAELPPCSAEVEYRHVRPTLGEVDLGFAGRCPAGNAVHAAIAALSVGDRLKVRVRTDGRWELLNQAGHVVGRLAGSFKPPSGMRRRSAKVFAVIGRSREASDPKYHDATRCEAWEVVVPELVFEPECGESR